MEKTAVQELITYFEQQKQQGCKNWCIEDLLAQLYKAKEMEKKQLFLSANTQAKQAYKAGQKSMYCGCYEISGCTSFEDWFYNKTFKTE